jgi:pSer/pThr/pTyr-binding forkhead associated (FHA) protein
MPKPLPLNESNPRAGTLIETEEDIRRAVLANKAAIPLATPIATRSPAGQASSKAPEVTPFRPTLRPPICILTILDDGKSEGEVVRIRSNRFIIGRTEGDLLLPHDEQISSRHIEITRQLVGGQQRWVVTDLQSTNGLFLRVSRTVLATGR